MGVEPIFRLVKSQLQSHILLREEEVHPMGIEPIFSLIKSQLQYQILLRMHI